MQNHAAQRHRLNRVVNFVYANTAETIDLDDLADVACLSKFHFARTFYSHQRETPFEFLWRVRLELAARKLAFVRDDSVTDIALDSGFSGPQTFSRAFRRRFGVSPSTFRSSNLWSYDGFADDRIVGEATFRPEVDLSNFDADSRLVRIENRPAYRVAYIRHHGPYGDVGGSISAAYAAVKRWARTRGINRENTPCIGICPNSCRVTPARYCLYDACIVIPDGVEEDDIVSIRTIPSGRYAVLPVTCRLTGIYGIWEWLSSSWLRASGEKLGFHPSYEFFPTYAEDSTSGVHTELCLPLIDRTAETA